jgi:hypothetical protein
VIITCPVATSPAPAPAIVRISPAPAAIIRITPAPAIVRIAPAPAPGKAKAYTWSVVRIGIIITNINAGPITVRVVIVPVTIGIIAVVITYAFERIVKSLYACSIRIVVVIIFGKRTFVIGVSF